MNRTPLLCIAALAAVLPAAAWSGPGSGSKNPSRAQLAAPPAFDGFESESTSVVTTFREQFTSGTNEGQWTWGNGFDAIESSGGNPGYWLRNNFLDTFAPQPSTTLGIPSQFTGDYRARGVNGIAVDVQVLAVDFSAADRPLTLMLFSDLNNADPNDDCSVGFIPDSDIPLPGQGWKRFQYQVPSSSTTMPANWGMVFGCSGLNRDAAWNAVLTDVDQVTFFFGDPRFFFIFQVWDVGLDNPSIRTSLP